MDWNDVKKSKRGAAKMAIKATSNGLTIFLPEPLPGTANKYWIACQYEGYVFLEGIELEITYLNDKDEDGNVMRPQLCKLLENKPATWNQPGVTYAQHIFYPDSDRTELHYFGHF
jgi:hypothetical protein